MMVKFVVCDKQKTRQSLMQDASRNIKKFWTKNRISILIPWMMPLIFSLWIGILNVPLAFIGFLMFSLIARIIVIKTSLFSGTVREDFESLLTEKEITLVDGSIISSDEIRFAKKYIKLFGFIAFICWVLVTAFLPSVGLSLVGYAFWLLIFQALSKTYLIVKDLPLNGFPFFRSNSRTRNNSDTKISVGVMDNSTNPLHPSNIGNPANPNYIFK